ncbi:CPBP family intramembrane glutamic endopeptidase [Spiroplasma turonicum]|uniref:CAAX amino terminal membrane bound protease n=1 Tax=Spiroplasma turonicum TaxID=216946 RepID=A0A0K1P605_9MOLU|nr:CPBP family intramembrane glutamic endopeptidase [Spiroplasma turonicum]AKU79352.1 CAAX amino terminal membrane bound protease [Spiroplasma turonicum]ALX70373.1 CAAX amino terminal membrane bound protease [Spiroplasma turonicum]
MKSFSKYREEKFGLEESYKFDFNSLNYKIDGIIFITTSFIIPFVFSLFFRIFFNLKSNITAQEIFFYVNMASNLFGLVIFILRNPRKILTNSYSLFYFFIILPSLIYIVIGSITNPLISDYENKESIGKIIQGITQIISEIIIIILAFCLDKKIVKRIFNTFKKSYVPLIFWVVIGLLTLIIISTAFFSILIENNLLKFPQSDNQDSLIKMLDQNQPNSIRITYIILLVLLTIIVAPICEELCMRESYFSNCSNEYIGLIFSALTFGFIHYGNTGDFEHFMSYTMAGIILASIFWFSKGNITYSWLVHLLNNLFALILVFVL